MGDSAGSGERTFDPEQVNLILRSAAEMDRRERPRDEQVGDMRVYGTHGDLTLSEIQDIGAEAGIDRHAVASAMLGVTLDAAHAATPRLHHVHVIPGQIDANALDQIADAVRARMHGLEVRRSEGALEFEITRKGGELGRLLVNVRARDGATAISIWSDAPHMSVSELVLCGAVGAPVALFPMVAMTGGVWPTGGLFVGLAAAGAAAGTAAAMVWRRAAAARWRKRVIELLTPIVVQVNELAARSPSDAAP